MRRSPYAVLLAAAMLAGCTSSPEPAVTPSVTPAPTVTVTATPSAPPSPTATPSASASATGSPASDCATFGTEVAGASSPDWASDLASGLWGVTQRLGVHECYDRWVLEFAGEGEPGWQVTPREARTFPQDASGEDLAPPLAGSASLEILVGAWVDGTAIDRPGYDGPRTLTGSGAIREARMVGAFEGITQVGLGLDQARPYRVTWLEDPPRLVVDVYTG